MHNNFLSAPLIRAALRLAHRRSIVPLGRFTLRIKILIKHLAAAPCILRVKGWRWLRFQGVNEYMMISACGGSVLAAIYSRAGNAEPCFKYISALSTPLKPVWVEKKTEKGMQMQNKHHLFNVNNVSL